MKNLKQLRVFVKLEIDDPRLPRERKIFSHCEEGEAPVEFVSTVDGHYRQILYQAIDMGVNCISDRFQKKGHIETLHTREINTAFKSVA